MLTGSVKASPASCGVGSICERARYIIHNNQIILPDARVPVMRHPLQSAVSLRLLDMLVVIATTLS